MGTFTVIEYEGQGMQSGNPIPCVQQPAKTEQAAITTSGTSQQSAAFGAGTRVVLVQTTSIVRIKFGTNPTASASTSIRMAADASEYHFVEPGAALKVAVIDAT